jgi:predicted neuraminidase
MKLAALIFLLATAAAGQAPTPAPAAPAQVASAPNPFVTADGVMRVSTKDPAMMEAYMPALYKTSHAANLAMLKDGSLGLIWMSGDTATHTVILLSYKPKGSSAWSTPKQLPSTPEQSLENPVLFQDPAGDLWAFATEETHVLAWTSKDLGKTWGRATRVFGDKAVTRQPIVLLDHGLWALSVYYAPTPSAVAGSESHYTAIELSSDHGKSWRECLVPGSGGLVQATLVPLHADDTIAFLRSRFADWVYVSHSKDGCTWTEPVATAMPSNNASIQAIRLHDGRILIAFDNIHAKSTREKPEMPGRVPLSLAMSSDEGKSWKWIRDLEVDTSKGGPADPNIRQEYSYPSVMETPEHKIMVAYTYRRQTIKVLSLDEDWVTKGSTQGLLKP